MIFVFSSKWIKHITHHPRLVGCTVIYYTDGEWDISVSQTVRLTFAIAQILRFQSRSEGPRRERRKMAMACLLRYSGIQQFFLLSHALNTIRPRRLRRRSLSSLKSDVCFAEPFLENIFSRDGQDLKHWPSQQGWRRLRNWRM